MSDGGCLKDLQWCWYGLFVGSPTATEVLPRLFMGGLNRDEKFYARHSITHVVTLCGYGPPKYLSLQKMHMPMSDCPCSDVVTRIRPIVQFIHKGRLQGGGVYVHCLRGVSRSSAMIIAYLMAVFDLEYDEAFRFLKSKRWCAFPNPGFQRQLSKLFDRRSLVELLDKIGANNEYKKTMKLQDHMAFNSW
mmetsp:Transcript_14639/g.27780  ORF Transcript_14639/g.27780 Transcript_14639/m.27780 type:complete len:190 (+) Transcript_14639:43-612(+)